MRREVRKMSFYAIAEVDDGFTVIEVVDGQSAEDAALHATGQLVDPGPYDSYQDAFDALDQIDVLDDEIDAY